jgi:molybdate transport system substrate-binding protein
VIRIVSSMATRHLLADLVAALAASNASGGPDPGGGVVRPTSDVSVESMGGVDAARRVAAGEAFDGVVLASGAIDTLIAQGAVVPGSRVDLVKSPMAAAVRTGTMHPSIASEGAVKQAVLSAHHIGYSTGPSGDHLLALLERWGIHAAVKDRLVQARPGIPVASLVAGGETDLGFQQLSELMNVDGVDVVGLLPESIQGTTTFSGGIARASTRPDHVREVLAFMASLAVAPIKRKHGMEPA